MRRAVNLFKTLALCFTVSVILSSIHCCAENVYGYWDTTTNLWVPKPVSPIPTPLSSISPTREKIILKESLILPVRDEFIALELAKRYMESTDYPEVAKLSLIEQPSDNYFYGKGKRSLFYNGTGVFSKSQQPVFIVTYRVASKVHPQQIDFAVFQNTGFVKEISRSELDQVDTGSAANYAAADYLNLGQKGILILTGKSCKLVSGTHLVRCEGEYLLKDTQEFVFLVSHTEYTSKAKDKIKVKEQYAVVKKTGEVRKITLDQLEPMPQKEQPQKNS